MTVVKAVDVKKDYGLNDQTVHALRGINLEFGAGEFSAIAGPSGSGKSTFLHLIGCLDTLTGGTIAVGGTDTGKMSRKDLALLRRQSIGFIFQAYNLIENLTVEENILLPAMLSGKKRGDIATDLDELLGAVGLGERRKHRPVELSGGQQQRAAIARALINRPDVVFADEPTGKDLF